MVFNSIIKTFILSIHADNQVTKGRICTERHNSLFHFRPMSCIVHIKDNSCHEYNIIDQIIPIESGDLKRQFSLARHNMPHSCSIGFVSRERTDPLIRTIVAGHDVFWKYQPLQ